MSFARLTGFLSAAALVAALGAAAPAEAKTGTKVGSLNCTVSGGVGMILGSSKSMTCRFKPAGGGKT